MLTIYQLVDRSSDIGSVTKVAYAALEDGLWCKNVVGIHSFKFFFNSYLGRPLRLQCKVLFQAISI